MYLSTRNSNATHIILTVLHGSPNKTSGDRAIENRSVSESGDTVPSPVKSSAK